MARLNVYVPDAVAEQARAAGLNVSALTQEAIGRALAIHATDRWLALLPQHPPHVSHRAALQALDDARDDLGTSA